MNGLTRAKQHPRKTGADAPRQRPIVRRSLADLELFTGVTALAGGALLTVRPDGSLLRADPSVLAGTPFSDWRVPGVLLATLVGGGFLLTGWWTRRNHRHARELSLFAGTGLIAFETAELAWLGFQPLEAVFAVVGVVTVTLAWRMHDTAGENITDLNSLMSTAVMKLRN